MFTPPYGMMEMDDFDHKIMTELELQWLQQDDNSVGNQETDKPKNSPLKMTRPKIKKQPMFQRKS